MQSNKRVFRHESLQDGKTIRKFLLAIADGLESGELSFDDGEDEISLCPEGLLQLKISATHEDGRNRVNLRVTWHDKDLGLDVKKPLQINGKKGKP